MLYDSVPDVLFQLIRMAFIPGKKYHFYVADFSAVEARIIAKILLVQHYHSLSLL